MKRLVREFGDVFTINTDVKTNIHVLYCESCLVKANCDQRFCHNMSSILFQAKIYLYFSIYKVVFLLIDFMKTYYFFTKHN
jgi:hypothetical protein